jgi:hypothetical protein
MDLIPAFATFFACIFYEQLEVGIVIGRREILTLLIFLPVLFLGLLLDQDPLVRGTGQGSGFFYHQANLGQTLIPTFCDFFMTFNL